MPDPVRPIGSAGKSPSAAGGNPFPRFNYVLPTRYGVIFLVALVGMLWGSTNYQSNLGFALTFLLGAMALVSILHTHRNLSGLVLTAGPTGPVFAGQTARVEIYAQVDRPRQSINLQLAGGPVHITDLRPGRLNSLVLSFPAPHRGRCRPAPLLVWTEYPFGLFRCWIKAGLKLEILVYPRPAKQPRPLSYSRAGAQDQDQGEPGQGVDDFKGLRGYVPGDPPQRIAWKASPRSQGLLTKEFEGWIGGRAVLDYFSLTDLKSVEDRLSQLCRQVLTADALKIDYGLNLPGHQEPAGRGQRHMHRCLSTLALFDMAGETD